MSNLELDITQLLDDEFGLDDMEKDSPIFSNNLLDSMDVLRLILLLEKQYEISISAFDVTIDMFDSISSITSFVQSQVNN